LENGDHVRQLGIAGLGGWGRLGTVVVITGIPEVNGGAGKSDRGNEQDGAEHLGDRGTTRSRRLLSHVNPVRA
jgi:hypothetical protein